MKRLTIFLVLVVLPILTVKAQDIKVTKDVLYTIDKSIPSYLTIADRGSIKKQKVKARGNSFALKKILRLNDETTLELMDTLTDITGGFHEVYREYYKGIEIEGSRCIIHYDKEGYAVNVNGNFRTINNLETSPRINEATALSYALNDIGAEKYAWEDKAYEEQLRQMEEDVTNLYPKGKLVIYMKDGVSHLAYKFYIESILPQQNLCVYTDANSGKILCKYSTVCDITASVSTIYSGQRNIETQHYSSYYRLRDYTRGNGIFTFKYNSNFADSDYTSQNNIWSNLIGNDRNALDVHWGLETTYDFYYNTFGRNSFDNQGSIIKGFVNWNNNNAQWVGSRKVMRFGLYAQTNPIVSLDVTAHELTHGVTESTSQLLYQEESGAINEGMSDVFGVCVEKEAKPSNGNNIWILGEDFVMGGIRDIRNPTCKYYKGVGWDYDYNNNDYGGVHTNSGVFNYWFYLLACGGSGTNQAGYSYSLSGIGIDKAIQICYLMNTSYLTSNSTYSDARMCSELAAQALGYDYAIRLMVSEAWYIVGVGEAPPQYISGPTTICNAATFHIDYLPNSCIVNWSVNNNCAQIVSGQGTESVTLQRNYDGWTTLTATISHNGTVIKTLSKEIMVGTPSPSMVVYPISADGEWGYWRSDLHGNKIEVDGYSGNYPSYVVDLYRINNDFSIGQQVGHWTRNSLDNMTFGYYPPGWYYIEIVGVNDCGTSSPVGTEIESVDGSWRQPRMFSFNYHQGSEMLTVTLNPALGSRQAVSSCEIQLWNGNTMLRKFRMTDGKLQIPMSGMKSGLYIVRAVTDDGKSQQHKLMKK